MSKLESAEVAKAIRQASIHNIVQFTPDEPATDSAHSLDFDNVRVEGETFSGTSVQVEISYREAVIEDPFEAKIGLPSAVQGLKADVRGLSVGYAGTGALSSAIFPTGTCRTSGKCG